MWLCHSYVRIFLALSAHAHDSPHYDQKGETLGVVLSDEDKTLNRGGTIGWGQLDYGEGIIDKRALVTGGAHPLGIGFAAAKSLATAGYEVIVTGVSDSEIAQTPRADRVQAKLLDVRDGGAVRALIADLERLDALVNCAGMSSRNEFDLEMFARTVEVNLTGTMRMCMAAHGLLAQSKGAIVNIASMYATFGSPIVPGYSASKGGVVQLTKSLAAAWAGESIRVNAIAPGWIRTAMARPLWEEPTVAAAIAARTPMGRWGEPDECGDVVAFLCSHQARFVTGVTIPVDGGYLVSG